MIEGTVLVLPDSRSGQSTPLQEPRHRGSQQLRGPRPIAGAEAQLDRLPDMIAGQEPIRRPQLHAYRLRLVGLLLSQRIPEQPVTAVPLVSRVERNNEEVGPVELLENRCGTVRSKDLIAERPGQPLENRRPHQQMTLIRREPVEHLGGQIVEDVPVITVDGPRRGRRSGGTAETQRRKLQPRCPALGALPQQEGRPVVQGCVTDAPQERGRLVDTEAQIHRSQLGQLTPGPHPRQWQRRIYPGRQYDPQGRRHVGKEELHVLVDVCCVQQVVIVEHQDVVPSERAQFVEQHRHGSIQRAQPRGPERSERGRGDDFGTL